MLIGRLHALAIHHAPARRRQIPHPALPGPVHIIREREKSIARTRHPIQLPRMLPPLLVSNRRGNTLEQTLPLLLLPALKYFGSDKQVNGVRLVGALDTLFEGKREDARVVAHPPVVRFAAGEARTVDARLLAGADADEGAFVGVGDAVGLRVF